ncbi:hypothetical protein [Bartonella harrusi]|uniref:Uncharacterized protein n=1 Tax=Bartonella harrusi TaxID=2961895 RepID=A0ABY5ETN8_9HYPH|nr:hypothetical protein [Bartonella harrusi]UTO28206.1 hypothetical protein NMK50_08590 [Bartonella harrusi]
MVQRGTIKQQCLSRTKTTTQKRAKETFFLKEVFSPSPPIRLSVQRLEHGQSLELPHDPWQALRSL